MKHFEIINETLKSLDPGEAVVTVKLNSPTSLRVVQSKWAPSIAEDSFHNMLINKFAARTMLSSGPDKGYVVDTISTVANIKDHVVSTIMKIYQDSCPNKEPRRTKLYKKIYGLVRSANRSDKADLLNFMFDIAQYEYSVTKEFTLKNSVNDVHRKNIYKLFEIMENKHGGKENGNK